MQLVFDIGNTNIKWGLHDGNSIVSTDQLSVVEFAHDPEVRLGVEHKPVREIAAASVAAGFVSDKLGAWSRQAFQLPVNWIATRARALGVTCAYRDPRGLGVDRWAAVVAAWHKVRNNVIVIDCGTALTVDVVDADGGHRGGWIAPGRALMMRGLEENTSGISVDQGDFNGAPATSTDDAVFSGAMIAAGAFLEKSVALLTAAAGAEPTCILTGGDAKILAPYLAFDFEYRPHLVLEGVSLLAGDKQ